MNKLITILIIGFLGLNSGSPLPSDPGSLAYDSRLLETEDLTSRIDTYLTKTFHYDRKEKAVKSFKLALQLGETVSNCHWCANALQKIETIKKDVRNRKI